MHVVWDRAHFREVVDYDTWETELLADDDLERQIADGHIVPINIQSDGAFVITVRADPFNVPALSAEETGRVIATSEPYLLDCRGHIEISGLECVEAVPHFPGVVTGVNFDVSHCYIIGQRYDYSLFTANLAKLPGFEPISRTPHPS